MREDLQEVIELERRLHDSAVRRSRRLAGELLHPEFHEFGASGQVWDRASVMEMMASEDSGDAPLADHFVSTRLAADVIHLTYRTRTPGRTVVRSSLWRRDGGDTWRIYFHQGTVQQGAHLERDPATAS